MRFSPSPICLGDPWLESAFISRVGCVSRHHFVCFPAESRQCFVFLLGFSCQQNQAELALFLVLSVCVIEILGHVERLTGENKRTTTPLPCSSSGVHDGREQEGAQRHFLVRVRLLQWCDERLVRPGSVCSALMCCWSRTSLRLCCRSNKEKLVHACFPCTGWCRCTCIACWFPKSIIFALCFFCWLPRSLVIALYFSCQFPWIYDDLAVFLSPVVCSNATLCPCRARSPRFSLVLERRHHRRHVFCSHGHVSGHVVWGGLPDALNGDRVSVSSSTPWTAVSKSWGRSHQRGGDMGNRCSSRWSQSVGAGDDKPAEPCTKRRKTHMPPEVKEWFCSLARVKRNWTMTQCLRFAKRALPSFFEHAHIDTTRKWLSHETSSTALGRPRSLEPAAVLALPDIVSRVCSRVCYDARVWVELLNAHQSTSTRSRCRSAARPHGSFVTVKTQASSRLSGHRARVILLQSVIIALSYGVFLLPMQHSHAVFARISVHGSQNPQFFKHIHHKDRQQ